MKISKAIEKAINTTLWDGKRRRDLYPGNKMGFSCVAVAKVLGVHTGSGVDVFVRVNTGMVRMGLITMSYTQFNDIVRGPKRQYARALWLTWAALMAEEQGE